MPLSLTTMCALVRFWRLTTLLELGKLVTENIHIVENSRSKRERILCVFSRNGVSGKMCTVIPKRPKSFSPFEEAAFDEALLLHLAERLKERITLQAIFYAYSL